MITNLNPHSTVLRDNFEAIAKEYVVTNNWEAISQALSGRFSSM
jgi:hypothetical protein